MTRKALALLGAALLVISLFTPLVALPVVGSVNLFGTGSNPVALVLLALAILAAALAARDRLDDLAWPGVAAVGLVLYHFMRIQYGLSQMREGMKDLADNPFGGIAVAAMQSVQLQWGWIPLTAGAALVTYVGWGARKERGSAWLAFADRPAKGVAAVSAAALVVPLMIGLSGDLRSKLQTSPDPTSPAGPIATATSAAPAAADTDTPDQIAYARDHVQLYELRARYFDSLLDGRIPGVRFKIKNTGTRTLTKVQVKVVFHDEKGNAIAEEEYYPVLVSEYSFGDNKPLRPNYIWQQEPDSFYSAKGVPSEWKAGAATATIAHVEFAEAP